MNRTTGGPDKTSRREFLTASALSDETGKVKYFEGTPIPTSVLIVALLGIAFTYPLFGKLMDLVDWPLAFMISGTATVLLGLIWSVLATDKPPRAAEQFLCSRRYPWCLSSVHG